MDQRYAAILAHYVELAQLPAWKAYVWDRVNEMAEQSSVWKDLPADLVREVKRDSLPRPTNNTGNSSSQSN